MTIAVHWIQCSTCTHSSCFCVPFSEKSTHMVHPIKRPLRITAENVKEKIWDAYDVFIFDMDGVIWKLDSAIDGAGTAVRRLQAMDKKVFFLTNNSLYRSADFKAKLDRLDIAKNFPEDNILGSSYCTALMLRNLGITGKVLTLCTASMMTELREFFAKHPTEPLIEFIEPPTTFFPEDPTRTVWPSDFPEKLPDNISAVVMGFDPQFNYCRAAFTTAVLGAYPNIPFIVSNFDLRYPAPQYILPGTGCFIKSIEVASGRHSIVAGKPGDTALREISRRFPNVDQKRMLMVGDNLLTDIAFGRLNGISTALVETGVHDEKNVGVGEAVSECPDFVLEGISVLAGI